MKYPTVLSNHYYISGSTPLFPPIKKTPKQNKEFGADSRQGNQSHSGNVVCLRAVRWTSSPVTLRLARTWCSLQHLLPIHKTPKQRGGREGEPHMVEVGLSWSEMLNSDQSFFFFLMGKYRYEYWVYSQGGQSYVFVIASWTSSLVVPGLAITSVSVGFSNLNTSYIISRAISRLKWSNRD